MELAIFRSLDEIPNSTPFPNFGLRVDVASLFRPGSELIR